MVVSSTRAYIGRDPVRKLGKDCAGPVIIHKCPSTPGTAWMTMSTGHGHIGVVDGQVIYEDTSSNGTLVNGAKLCKALITLQKGAVVHFDNSHISHLSFKLEEVPADVQPSLRNIITYSPPAFKATPPADNSRSSCPTCKGQAEKTQAYRKEADGWMARLKEVEEKAQVAALEAQEQLKESRKVGEEHKKAAEEQMKLTEERTARASELEMELQASRQVAEKATVDCSEARVQLTEQQQELAGMREEEEQRTAEKVAAVEATAQKERAAKQAAEASLQQATADLCEKTRYAHDLDEKYEHMRQEILREAQQMEELLQDLMKCRQDFTKCAVRAQQTYGTGHAPSQQALESNSQDAAAAAQNTPSSRHLYPNNSAAAPLATLVMATQQVQGATAAPASSAAHSPSGGLAPSSTARSISLHQQQQSAASGGGAESEQVTATDEGYSRVPAPQTQIDADQCATQIVPDQFATQIVAAQVPEEDRELDALMDTCIEGDAATAAASAEGAAQGTEEGNTGGGSAVSDVHDDSDGDAMDASLGSKDGGAAQNGDVVQNGDGEENGDVAQDGDGERQGASGQEGSAGKRALEEEDAEDDVVEIVGKKRRTSTSGDALGSTAQRVAAYELRTSHAPPNGTVTAHGGESNAERDEYEEPEAVATPGATPEGGPAIGEAATDEAATDEHQPERVHAPNHESPWNPPFYEDSPGGEMLDPGSEVLRRTLEKMGPRT